jgi:hypothetical protein
MERNYSSTNQSSMEQYETWQKTNDIKFISPKQGASLDDELRIRLKTELKQLNSITFNEFYLQHKYHEVQSFVGKVGIKTINEVKEMMYRPTSLDDFHNIEPELLYVHESVEIPHTNIFGETSIREIPHKENLIQHWQIIRTLVSSSRNDLLLGRAMRFLVRDKPTGKYLGIICIGGGLPTITVLNKEYQWQITDEFKRDGRITNTANGQVVVPTQPNGRLFQMGKLLSLLCLSKPMVEKYQELYGQKLVAIHTTALYGHKGISQYDNLIHFKNLGLTTGSSAMKVSNETYKEICNWLRVRYPYQQFVHHDELNTYGELRMRDKKNRILITAFKKLGFKKEEYTSGHKRLVYNSFLYSNASDYLNRKIEEHELVPAYDNSVNILTEYWKYGVLGKLGYKTELMKTDIDDKRQEMRLRMKSGVLGHVEYLKKQNVSLYKPTDDWYGDVYKKSWNYMKTKYSEVIGR